MTLSPCYLLDKVDELETILQDMEGAYDQQKTEADEAISSWESRSLEMEHRVFELESEAASRVKESSVELIRLLQSELRLKQRLLSLNQNASSQAEDVETIYEVFEAESTPTRISKLKTLLEERNNSLILWLESFDIERSSMEQRCQALSVKLESTEIEMDTLQSQLEQARNDTGTQVAEEKIAELTSNLSRLESRCAELASIEAATREATASEIAVLKQQPTKVDQIDALQSVNASLVEERDRLKSLADELEEELRETSHVMQAHLTSDISDKATEMVAQALREQICELRIDASGNELALEGERQTRIAAEREVSRLRTDLSALLGMQDTNESHAEIQRRTIEARENFHRTERSEIEALKKALSRALDELESTRHAEKEAQARASKAGLHISMYENEIIEAKSDLKFMAQSMDEMREAESSRRASLEYRITSLENDHAVQRRFHSAEMENLRNEIHQVCIERDRLFQSLNESEKAKDALVRASSRTSEFDGGGVPQFELAKLRLEKAQLLSATSEETSRSARRIREAVAAVSSSAEADVLLEKELRLAAENTLNNIKLEMKELQSEVDSTRTEAQSQAQDINGELGKDLRGLKARAHLLSEENTSLRAQLESTKSDAQSRIARLTEDFQAAKLRSSQLEREGRYEAEVQSEMARLKASQSSEVGQTPPVVCQTSTEGSDSMEDSVTELYDLIRKQKQAIEEERALYYELLAEHDDLLALLAQQEIVRGCLDSALVQAAGTDAVERAMRKAELTAMDQHGKHVQLADHY